jgi:hypothetical protein
LFSPQVFRESLFPITAALDVSLSVHRTALLNAQSKKAQPADADAPVADGQIAPGEIPATDGDAMVADDEDHEEHVLAIQKQQHQQIMMMEQQQRHYNEPDFHLERLENSSILARRAKR